MTVHLLKMCVGIDSVRHLRNAQRHRLERMAAAGEPAMLRHWTRNRPRRAAEVCDGGSIYWIIKGQIRVRQRITDIEVVADRHAAKRCALVLDTELVETAPRPARPIQGWRYLEPVDAPPDRGSVPDDAEDMPETMARELQDLGLL
ncbi:MAG: DUF1489 domain-containing protein [Alphaproteobacteria bacterium]|jgi:hypothetical protein|nr:DUF1489 domain-containing protein [Alphaproteobacteria bacterium]MDP6517039.1 DUF1489 domain-containing protein [Alphaproteobacteria bacterium]|tara:strand:+ start:235 stop:672 length:438 start_codon:yes stop_codon:yes gene_type:complete